MAARGDAAQRGPRPRELRTGAAQRRGVSEAEIIRQGIHLAAMANRVWDEPLFSRTFEGGGRTLAKTEVRDVVADAARRETETGTAA
ncbi:hypothetical protein [Streptomyces sp. P9-A4]|uniref:hypothetical protein n=1 Tax=Streptomyces sp. P9-A4 TaxID=3072285 RepID=UPI002FCA6BEF